MKMTEAELQELTILTAMGMVPTGSLAYTIMNGFMEEQLRTSWRQGFNGRQNNDWNTESLLARLE